MYRLIIVVLTALIATNVAQAAKMYRWVDENGVTHFSTRQPPRQNADKTQLQGGRLKSLGSSTESDQTAKIQRQQLGTSNWQECDSSLCQLVRQIDPDCQTSFCSRAKTYSNDCSSAGCLSKKVAFEKEMQDRLSAQNELRQGQAINANVTPVAPGTQSQD